MPSVREKPETRPAQQRESSDPASMWSCDPLQPPTLSTDTPASPRVHLATPRPRPRPAALRAHWALHRAQAAVPSRAARWPSQLVNFSRVAAAWTACFACSPSASPCTLRTAWPGRCRLTGSTRSIPTCCTGEGDRKDPSGGPCRSRTGGAPASPRRLWSSRPTTARTASTSSCARWPRGACDVACAGRRVTGPSPGTPSSSRRTTSGCSTMRAAPWGMGAPSRL